MVERPAFSEFALSCQPLNYPAQIVPTSLIGVIPGSSEVGVVDGLSIEDEHDLDIAIRKCNTQRYSPMQGFDRVFGLADRSQQFRKVYFSHALHDPFQHTSL